jgi:hypothetical protein
MTGSTRWILAAFLIALTGFAPGTAAAQGKPAGKSSAKKAEIGAGTTDATTTGTSHQQAGGGKPKAPVAPGNDLCMSYQGKVHEECLTTVTRRSGGEAGPNRAAPNGSSQ